MVTSEAEGAVVENIRRKESDARRMAAEMSEHTSEIVKASIRATTRDTTAYMPNVRMHVPSWIRTEREES